MRLFTGTVLIILAGLSGLTALGAVVSAILAWNAVETLAAVESIFGSLIAALLFAILCRSLFRAGQRRLEPDLESREDERQTAEGAGQTSSEDL